MSGDPRIRKHDEELHETYLVGGPFASPFLAHRSSRWAEPEVCQLVSFMAPFFLETRVVNSRLMQLNLCTRTNLLRRYRCEMV